MAIVITKKMKTRKKTHQPKNEAQILPTLCKVPCLFFSLFAVTLAPPNFPLFPVVVFLLTFWLPPPPPPPPRPWLFPPIVLLCPLVACFCCTLCFPAIGLLRSWVPCLCCTDWPFCFLPILFLCFWLAAAPLVCCFPCCCRTPFFWVCCVLSFCVFFLSFFCSLIISSVYKRVNLNIHYMRRDFRKNAFSCR